jgi:2-polyprenyl-6-methoxyphenol hydroxylase-like FAD-dependent oxidoreductase
LTILIAGAGPVGLTLAVELARFGIATRLIDRAPHATETSKALVIWSRTLELMERAGYARVFAESGGHAHAAALHHGGKVLGRASFADVSSPFNFALMIPQRDTERLLAAEAQKLGVAVERQVELMGVLQGADAVEAHLRHADGREEVFKTPWLIGCDGAHSAVRHALGIEFQGDTRADDFFVADVRLAGADIPPSDEISIYFHRDGPFVVFPMPGGRARVIASAGRTDASHPRPDPTLSEVQTLANERVGGDFKLLDPVWLAVFRINERKVADYRHGRVFLAGDAAHIHSPAGGQGMNTGMQDAFNLAWKLAMVLHGDARATLLDSYSPERSAVGDQVLRNATRLTDVGTLANPASQAARNFLLHLLLGLHAIQSKLVTAMSEIDIEYPKSPLSEGPASGARFPPSEYAGSAPGSDNRPRFALFASDEATGAAFAARYPRLLRAECRRPPDAGRVLIVRPDGYVGLSARAGEWEAADRYLKRFAS